MENALTRIARWIAECPPHAHSLATQRASAAVQDTIACMLAGARAEVTLRTAQALAGLGSGPCRAIGGGQTAAPWAAMLNGTAAHALDFDDYDFSAVSHPSAVLVPALLALAEERSANGSAVLDAYVVGYETMACVGKAINMAHYERGWHATATLGTLGAAAACARLSGLDQAACSASMSIATSMAAGFKSQFGTMTKPLHAGLAAKNGLLAARLAGSGITASPQTLDGRWSILTLLAGDAAHGFDRALAELGARLAIEQFGLVIKPFPTCGYTHRAIAGLLQLRLAHNFDAAAVERVEAELPDRNTHNLTYPTPGTDAEARFSMHYCLACALLGGAVTESDFQAEAIMRPAVRALLPRIVLLSYPADPNGTDSSPLEPDHVRVFLKDGQRLAISVGHVPGGPGSPLSDQQQRDKLHQCAEPVIGALNTRALQAALDAFPRLPNVGAVTRHLSCGDTSQAPSSPDVLVQQMGPALGPTA